MFSRKMFFIALMAFVVSLPFAGSVFAKDGSYVPVAKIMVMDLARVIKDSSAGQDIRRQVTSLQRATQEDFRAKIADLGEREKQLESERSVLSEDRYRERRIELRTEIETLQQTARAEVEKLQSAVASAEQYIRRTLDPILSDLMKRYGATMVVNSASVLARTSGTDVTATALRRLDENLPGLELPKGPSPRSETP